MGSPSNKPCPLTSQTLCVKPHPVERAKAPVQLTAIVSGWSPLDRRTDCRWYSRWAACERCGDGEQCLWKHSSSSLSAPGPMYNGVVSAWHGCGCSMRTCSSFFFWYKRRADGLQLNLPQQDCCEPPDMTMGHMALGPMSIKERVHQLFASTSPANKERGLQSWNELHARAVTGSPVNQG
ncbi:hypothetical protein LIA77_07092 [Sarocladium implicatum]|nr:hypothetical protein LIA77_07092 [Sarocladium implicatum]